ncbi:MAG: AraC family transcriptional regulator [Firmicutes bacterium]|nr:AraC family transcriptional regulator [Bacillota bacterium]
MVYATADRSITQFHFLAEGARDLPAVLLAGHEWRTAQDRYDWDCRRREDSHLIFQYTVSGCGELEVGGQWVSLPAGTAFLIEVPGPFHYRLPAMSAHWELQFVSLSQACLPWWVHIVTGLGRTIELTPEHDLVQQLQNLSSMSQQGKVDAFANSARAYAFLMGLYRHLHALPSASHLPLPVQKALACIERDAHCPIGLDDIALAAGVSKFHLIRLFRQHVGDSPTRRLTKERISSAARMLVETTLTVEQIAEQCGFQSGNYFAKAFRKWMNTSPSEFRRESGIRGVNRLEIT